MTDLIRYLPGVTEDGRLALWCTDCAENPGAPNSDPFWTDADAAEQVTELCLADLVAIAEQHEREHHADEPTSSNALTPAQQATLGRPCLCYPACAAEG
jgi:hypothetical protein